MYRYYVQVFGTCCTQCIPLVTSCWVKWHTHPFNGHFSRTTWVSRYQKGKTNLDFTEAKDSGISWAICKSASHSIQITIPAPHHSFFTERMLFLPPNQQRQSTEGKVQMWFKLPSCLKVRMTVVNLFHFWSETNHMQISIKPQFHSILNYRSLKSRGQQWTTRSLWMMSSFQMQVLTVIYNDHSLRWIPLYNKHTACDNLPLFFRIP